MNSTSSFLFWGALLGALLFVGAKGVGPAPALGPFLDPANGIWGVAYSAEFDAESMAHIPGLDGDVEVVYDDRRVPHIFATTILDAQRALGYVVARDRLFELEIQTRATMGTLTEIAGPAALGVDQRSRELGLAWAARRDYERLVTEMPNLVRALEAYADGVNAYIDSLDPADYPFEYHLTSATPLRWEPIHTLYLLKRMGQTLAYSGTEARKAWIASRVGREAADALIPVNTPIQEPIVPFAGERTLSSPIPDPGEPDSEAAIQLATMTAFLGADDYGRDPDGPVVGSNNWAVGPSRSATGNAVLSGDPHLGLTLPSIWYEAHTVVPGELDTYGVTLAGTPSIIIGFNRDVAWTFTNTGGDVLDLYRERLDDSEAPTAYMLDGEWRPLDLRVEEYFGPDGDVIATDTIRHTHRGPIHSVNGVPMSMRWTVLDGQGEVPALLQANRATSVDEWLDIMSDNWYAPTQNGLVADRTGRIAIQSAGVYPIRPEGTQGDWYFDGTTSASDWSGRLVDVPRAVDPEQGYLASANQQPVDPGASDAYLGSDWPSPWRAMTINRLLRSKTDHTAADLEAYQTHPRSARADGFLGRILDIAEGLESEGRLEAEATQAVSLLREWNIEYTPDNTRAALFESVLEELHVSLWDELEDEEGTRRATPSTAITWMLFDQPDSPWWDDIDTEVVEDRDALVARSLARGLEELRTARGAEADGGWAWGEISPINIDHLLGLPALGRRGIAITGGDGLLSPTAAGGTHGASWRMVVELGEEVVARGTYPGGQSGNPVSSSYADRLPHWAAGELEDLRFPRSADELRSGDHARSVLRLTRGER